VKRRKRGVSERKRDEEKRENRREEGMYPGII